MLCAHWLREFPFAGLAFVSPEPCICQREAGFRAVTFQRCWSAGSSLNWVPGGVWCRVQRRRRIGRERSRGGRDRGGTRGERRAGGRPRGPVRAPCSRSPPRPDCVRIRAAEHSRATVCGAQCRVPPAAATTRGPRARRFSLEESRTGPRSTSGALIQATPADASAVQVRSDDVREGISIDARQRLASVW